jgi:hypothetical protein
MTPEEFIDRWRGSTRSERSAAQQHFLDLCDLLGVDRPGTADPFFCAGGEALTAFRSSDYPGRAPGRPRKMLDPGGQIA